MAAKTLHVEPIYGFYHGQDPRTFEPDVECCSTKEIEAHREAVKLAESSELKEWIDTTGSGCHTSKDGNIRILKSSYGIGVYHVVMTEDGDFVRDATFTDLKLGEWREDIDFRNE